MPLVHEVLDAAAELYDKLFVHLNDYKKLIIAVIIHMSVTNWVLRFGLGGILVWQSYSIMRDDQQIIKRDINQALGYYTDHFEFLSSLSVNKPDLYGELDSLI